MILYTILSSEDIFYKNENKKTSESVCITDPFEYIRNDEYSRVCNELQTCERGQNEYNRSGDSGNNSGSY